MRPGTAARWPRCAPCSTGSPAIEPFCEVFPASNYEHWQAGRASICNFWFVCAEGSGDPIGYIARQRDAL